MSKKLRIVVGSCVYRFSRIENTNLNIIKQSNVTTAFLFLHDTAKLPQNLTLSPT